MPASFPFIFQFVTFLQRIGCCAALYVLSLLLGFTVKFPEVFVRWIAKHASKKRGEKHIKITNNHTPTARRAWCYHAGEARLPGN